MYTAYFGFNENPFNLSPDPRYLFLSPQHREAMNHLLYGIHEKKGFIVITGGIGTGKTTLCRSLLASLNDSVATALVFNSAMAEIELLETITQEFGIAMGRLRRTRKRYIDKLNEFLLRNFAAGRNAVLLIDEAQNLSHAVMEQIRMISNLETEREKLLQIVLVGQPELKELLALPSLRQLNERITVRYDLHALDSEHVRRYIEHRLNVAGGGNVIFSRGACRRVYDQSEGNPRRINAICDRALLIAYTKDHRIIDGRIIREAVRDIGRSYLPPGWWRRIRARLFS